VLELEDDHRQRLGRATVGTTAREALADPPLEVHGNVDLHGRVVAVLSCCGVYRAHVFRIVS
jgi:hypothetical protein